MQDSPALGLSKYTFTHKITVFGLLLTIYTRKSFVVALFTLSARFFYFKKYILKYLKNFNFDLKHFLIKLQ